MGATITRNTLISKCVPSGELLVVLVFIWKWEQPKEYPPQQATCVLSSADPHCRPQLTQSSQCNAFHTISASLPVSPVSHLYIAITQE